MALALCSETTSLDRGHPPTWEQPPPSFGDFLIHIRVCQIQGWKQPHCLLQGHEIRSRPLEPPTTALLWQPPTVLRAIEHFPLAIQHQLTSQDLSAHSLTAHHHWR